MRTEGTRADTLDGPISTRPPSRAQLPWGCTMNIMNTRMPKKK